MPPVKPPRCCPNVCVFDTPTIRASRNAIVSTRAPAPGTGAVECSAARECWDKPGSRAAEIAIASTLIEIGGAPQGAPLPHVVALLRPGATFGRGRPRQRTDKAACPDP